MGQGGASPQPQRAAGPDRATARAGGATLAQATRLFALHRAWCSLLNSIPVKLTSALLGPTRFRGVVFLDVARLYSTIGIPRGGLTCLSDGAPVRRDRGSGFDHMSVQADRKRHCVGDDESIGSVRGLR